MLIIAFLACISGLLISSYIYFKKRRHQKLFCPRDNPCDIVIHSQYSSTLGVPNELLGLIYFVVVSVLLNYLVFSFQPQLGMYFILAIITKVILVLGGLFSIYLLAVQAFILKKWCTWCLGIAASNITLIVTVLIYLS